MIKINKTTALVSMLDWGLGHTTRCISIIKALQNNKIVVFVACNGVQKKIIESECEDIIFFSLNGYNIKYSKQKWLFSLYILFQLPKILYHIYAERKWLSKWLKVNHADVVISDNRYGFYNKNVQSIFITHQLTIQTPFKWLTQYVQKINYWFIHQFNECWIPDIENENGLAGILSHPEKMPKITIKYIGWLSRFKQNEQIENYTYKFCILLSGPEPQRSILEKKLYTLFINQNTPIIFIRGKTTTEYALPFNANISTIHLANTQQIQNAITNSEFIICRSGYTSLMELLPLKKKIIIIPTPGQTEQEFLAKYLHKKQWAYSVNQQSISTNIITSAINGFTFLPIHIYNNENALQEAIENIF
jgi:uncharacterized protein (TIGR00661 family)